MDPHGSIDIWYRTKYQALEVVFRSLDIHEQHVGVCVLRSRGMGSVVPRHRVLGPVSMGSQQVAQTWKT